MFGRRKRWRRRLSPAAPQRRRQRPGAAIRKRDWIKLLLVLGAILWLGLGEPLSQLDAILGFLGFH